MVGESKSGKMKCPSCLRWIPEEEMVGFECVSCDINRWEAEKERMEDEEVEE